MAELKHKVLSEKIIAAAYQVHKELGCGFLEKVYKNALAVELEEAGVKILGTSPESIDLAEDRKRFREVMIKLGIPQPASGTAISLKEALAVAKKVGETENKSGTNGTEAAKGGGADVY